jgi:hypothetical protein
MSLVNQFEITLKDFWPDHSDGIFVTDRDRGTTTTISRRLYAKLKAYAKDNQLSFDTVVQQLRDEIHREPAANKAPTAMTRKFAKGDRVKFSLQGNVDVQRSPWSRLPTGRRGTVAHQSREQNGVPVIWDGTKTPHYIARHLLEPSDD